MGSMKFLNPHETSNEEMLETLKEIARITIFSFEYLKQEVRRCYLENKVLIIVDDSHHIDWDYNRFHTDTPEEIEKFVTKWANVTSKPRNEP